MRYCYYCMQEVENDKANYCPACGKKLEDKKENGRYLVPGTILQQRYIVGERIGAGGFGITYIGFDANLQRKVCIKEFFPEKYCDRSPDHLNIVTEEGILGERYKKGLEAFLQEAKNIAALQDIKGVVRVYAFFEENNTGYIIMEYLEGMDVKHILKHSGNRSDYEWARQVILSVLYILREIHKRGVIHRDISPDNIFVTNDGVITLIDFGAAKHAAASYDPDAEIVLKEGYAPIEQYSRSGRQGPYTDLYAVAALFYRLLTGMKPLPANERLANDSLVPPSEMGINIPEKAEMGMMMCLYLKSEYRLQSAEDFMECLDGLSFEPIYEPEWILPAPVLPKKKLFEQLLDWIVSMHPVMKLLLGVCLVALVCGAAILGSKNLRQSTGKVDEVVVENEDVLKDYVGQEYNTVLATLKDLGYTNIDMRYELNGKEKGEILTQSMPAGTSLNSADTLLFTVSGGDEIYTMPDFSSMSKKEIIAYYNALNYDVTSISNPYNDKEKLYEGDDKNGNFKRKRNKITIRSVCDDIVAKGDVINQSVKAGEQCTVDQEIEIMISLGAESSYKKEIPDFTGMSKAQVTKLLEDEKLTDYIKISYKENAGYSDKYEAGTVMSQSIEAGKKTNVLKLKGEKRTKKIELSLSSGPEPAPAPVQQTPVNQQQPSSGGGGGHIKVIRLE